MPEKEFWAAAVSLVGREWPAKERPKDIVHIDDLCMMETVWWCMIGDGLM